MLIYVIIITAFNELQQITTNESDNTLEAAMDGVIQLESCGEECFELVLRMCKITDEVYPSVMKELWS